MDYFLAAIAVAAFGYFIYTRVVKAKAKTYGSGSGGNGKNPGHTYPR